MSSCFAFRCKEADGSRRPNLIIFFSGSPSADSIIRRVKQDAECNLLPSRVCIIASAAQRKELESIRTSSFMRNEFDSLVGEIGKKLLILYYETTGEIYDHLKGAAISDAERQRILHAGMIDIFKRRKGLVESPANHHFLMPSGRHVNRFIRASNLLVTGHEVSFLALSLLGHLKQNIKRIYVDTSSISYLVCTAMLMRGSFGDNPPLVESFESYVGLRKSFDFVEGADSLVIVSATSNGALLEEIKDSTNFDDGQLLTLFHNGLPKGLIGLFDVSELEVRPIYRDHSNCSYCRDGSRIVRIVDDQFLPETPTAEAVLIRKSDFKRQDFFAEFLGRDVLRWKVPSSRHDDTPEHFFIDLGNALAPADSTASSHAAAKSLTASLEKEINKYFSHHIDHVIRLDDDGSKALCNLVGQFVKPSKPGMNWLTLSEVDATKLKGGGSAIVIAGAITSGRKLLEASRKLRLLADSSSTVYLVGFSKIPTDAQLNQLRRDLEMGGNTLVILRQSPMPRVSALDSTAWDVERNLLNKRRDPLASSTGEADALPDLFARRLDLLNELASGNIDASVASTQLFLPSTDDKPLALRPRFAFWSDIRPEYSTATQAEVYWTISAVLHDMRGPKSSLASTYHTRLIDPVCFDRFNDGVIQAALLRAAIPTELNYAIDSSFSRRMTDVVISIVREHGNEQGEAALEFMLALWSGRLRVADVHMEEIVEACADSAHEIVFIARQLPLQLGLAQ